MALNNLQTKEQPSIYSAKKLFIMAATMLVRRPRKEFLRDSRSSLNLTNPTSNTNFEDEIDIKFDASIPASLRPNSQELGWMRKDPWRGTHAVQLWITVMKLIHKGYFFKATKVACRLKSYCDILGAERVNSILALTSANGQNFFICSNALFELEKVDQQEYGDLAVSLFSDNELIDKDGTVIECPR
jgi:hypothetical protein